MACGATLAFAQSMVRLGGAAAAGDWSLVACAPGRRGDPRRRKPFRASSVIGPGADQRLEPNRPRAQWRQRSCIQVSAESRCELRLLLPPDWFQARSTIVDADR